MSLDGGGRVTDACGITVAVAQDGQASWLGARISGELANALTAILASSPLPDAPSQPPPALDACERTIAAALGARTLRHSGPSYVFEDHIRPVASSARVIRSDAAGRDELRRANPGNWEPVEWDELLDGLLGPWAMVVDGGEVLSICHTPVPMTDQATECGVWTPPGRARARLRRSDSVGVGRAVGPDAPLPLLPPRRGEHLVAARGGAPGPALHRLDVAGRDQRAGHRRASAQQPAERERCGLTRGGDGRDRDAAKAGTGFFTHNSFGERHGTGLLYGLPYRLPSGAIIVWARGGR